MMVWVRGVPILLFFFPLTIIPGWGGGAVVWRRGGCCFCVQVHDLERALELNPEHRNAGKYLQTTLLRRARVHETAGRRAQVRDNACTDESCTDWPCTGHACMGAGLVGGCIAVQ